MVRWFARQGHADALLTELAARGWAARVAELEGAGERNGHAGVVPAPLARLRRVIA